MDAGNYRPINTNAHLIVSKYLRIQYVAEVTSWSASGHEMQLKLRLLKSHDQINPKIKT